MDYKRKQGGGKPNSQGNKKFRRQDDDDEPMDFESELALMEELSEEQTEDTESQESIGK